MIAKPSWTAVRRKTRPQPTIPSGEWYEFSSNRSLNPRMAWYCYQLPTGQYLISMNSVKENFGYGFQWKIVEEMVWTGRAWVAVGTVLEGRVETEEDADRMWEDPVAFVTVNSV